MCTAAPPPPALDTSQASVEEAHWRIDELVRENNRLKGMVSVEHITGVAHGAAADYADRLQVGNSAVVVKIDHHRQQAARRRLKDRHRRRGRFRARSFQIDTPVRRPRESGGPGRAPRL